MKSSLLILTIVVCLLASNGCNRDATTTQTNPKGLEDKKREVIELKESLFASLLNGERPDRKTIQHVMKSMDQAVVSYPRDPEVLRVAGDFYFHLAKYREAAEHLATLSELSDEGVTELTTEDKLLLARSHYKVASYESSAQSMEILSSMVGYDATKKQFLADQATDPSELEAYMLLARQAALGNDKEFAKSTLDQMVKSNPESDALLARARLVRAMHHLGFGSIDEAKADIRAAHKRQPEHVAANLAMAKLSLEEDDFENAKKYAIAGLQHGESAPERSDLVRTLAKAHNLAGEPEQAIAVLDAELKRNSNAVDIKLLKANYLLDQCTEATAPQLNEAEQLIADLSATARHLEAKSLRARILVLQGEKAKAMQLIQRLLPVLQGDTLEDAEKLLNQLEAERSERGEPAAR